MNRGDLTEFAGMPMGNEGESSQVVGMLTKYCTWKTMPDAGILKCILFMPNLYLENGKVGEKKGSRRVESVGWRFGYARNEFLRFAMSRELRSRRGVSIVCIARKESMGGRG
jgi:hypothetical protein